MSAKFELPEGYAIVETKRGRRVDPIKQAECEKALAAGGLFLYQHLDPTDNLKDVTGPWYSFINSHYKTLQMVQVREPDGKLVSILLRPKA